MKAPSSKKPGSLTRQLAWLYLTSTASLLVLIAGFLYWTLKRNLEDTRLSLLASKVEVLRTLMQAPDKTEALASEVEHESAESSPFRYFIRILDANNQVLFESPGMQDVLELSFPVPLDVGSGPLNAIKESSSYRVATIASTSFILLAVRATTGKGGAEKRTIQIALDRSNEAALLGDYRNKLLISLAVGLILAAAAGAWVARRGMRPLVEITEATRQITASQLHERITSRSWPAELDELARAFDAMLDRLEDSFVRLSQFSADLAHALRSPINNLRVEAEVSLTRPRAPDEYQHVLASSLEEFDRLSRMIDGLLFLARAEDPKLATQRVPFEARKEMEAVREFYDALANEQKVEVTCTGAQMLTGDPMLFRRAVSNLLANALRHTSSGGCIRISVRSTEAHAIELSVQDNGSGIAPEHLPKIFDRFYRGDQPRSHVPGGSGLGLAIVQSIMRLHGGKALVETEVGRGSTFTLRFPRSQNI